MLSFIYIDLSLISQILTETFHFSLLFLGKQICLVQTRMNIENKRHSLDKTKLLVDWDWSKYHFKGRKNPSSINIQSVKMSHFKIYELFVQTSNELHFINLAGKEWMGYFLHLSNKKNTVVSMKMYYFCSLGATCK